MDQTGAETIREEIKKLTRQKEAAIRANELEKADELRDTIESLEEVLCATTED